MNSGNGVSGSGVSRISGDCKVQVYPAGMSLHAKIAAGNPKGKGIPEGRGTVKGWSLASRRRMREFLMTNRIPDGYDAYSVTLTIPGPVMEPKDCKTLFNRYSTALNRLDACSVWRIELQKRGQLHWHLMVGLPKKREVLQYNTEWITDLCKGPYSELFPLDWLSSIHRKERGPAVWQRAFFEDGNWINAARLHSLWYRMLSNLPMVDNEQRGRITRDQWPHAHDYASIVEPMRENDAAWFRYLNDHTTKLKQEQIPENIGRHWGKVGGKHFVQVEPQTYELTPGQYYRMLRWYNRLAQGMRQEPKAPFGSKKGTKRQRGKIGTYYAFADPKTCHRLAQHAASFPSRPADN